MSSNVKLAALLLVSFAATASVIYEVKNRKPPTGGVVVGLPSGPGAVVSSGPAPAAPAPPVGVAATATPALSTEVIAVAHADQAGPQPNIPVEGWKRNPFLTIDEEYKFNHPDLPVAEEKPPPKPVEPVNLPLYVVTGIIRGSSGNWAILNDRWSLHEGSQIGSEVVKEVKDHSVVLDHEGHLRELPLKGIEDTAAAATPTKEEKK
jgi:hypothetical protein